MSDNQLDLVSAIAAIDEKSLGDFLQRYRYAQAAGLTFGGYRDVSKVLGYADCLKFADYYARYRRNPIAARIIEAKPQSTWRGGAEILEDSNPDHLTTFETAWADLNDTLDIWKQFHRVDVLAGIGEYAVLLIGAKGDFSLPLTKINQKDLWYLKVYAQDEATIDQYESSTSSRRFGRPTRYQLTGIRRRQITSVFPRTLHWSRVLHVADGAIEDDICGQPRLERAWNRLDDLDKVIGGGSEAFWKRADQGLHINVDPSIPVDKTGKADKALQDEVDEYVHGLNRIIRTRGVDIESLGSDVASFGPSGDAIIAHIAAGTGIPQRILMGSERGHLASTQDKDNWDEQIHDRRAQYAEPIIVRPFIDRMVEITILPQPKQYEVRWPQMKSLDDSQKADVTKVIAEANKANGSPILTTDEIRDKIWGYGPIDITAVQQQIDLQTPDMPKAAKRLLKKRIALAIFSKDGDNIQNGPRLAVSNS